MPVQPPLGPASQPRSTPADPAAASTLPRITPPPQTHAPAGFLVLYYVGVVQVLQQLGIFEPGKVPPPVAGISSGALTAGVICSGVSAERFHDTVGPPAARARVRAEGGVEGGRVGPAGRAYQHK